MEWLHRTKHDGWFRQHTEPHTESLTNACELTVREGGVELGIPLGMEDDALSCWLWVRYYETAPLSVSLTVCAPSKAIVMERTVLRKDLRAALQRSVSYVGLGMGPGVTKGVTMFYLREDGVTMTILVPSDTLERFVRATDRLVAPDDRSEAIALSRAYGTVAKAGDQR